MDRTLPSGFESQILSYGWPHAQTLLTALRSTAPSLAVRANPAKGWSCHSRIYTSAEVDDTSGCDMSTSASIEGSR